MARTNEESEVIGHYLVPAHGRPAQPLLHESTVLFQDVVSDKLSTVEGAVEADAGKLEQFFLILHWASDVKGGTGSCPDQGAESNDANAAATKASVMVKQRTLLMIAAHSGSLRVLAYLLARGAEPSRKSPDGLTAYDFAVAGESSQAATAIAMMRDADSHPSSSTRSSSTTETHSFSGTEALRGNARQDLTDSDGSSYSTTDLTRPEYSTDDFRMFNFKVLRCSKRHAHDWRACPFAHPTENARRRDPREFKYCALACPDYKQGFCIRGDVCPYSHGVFECWLHPSRYRTQLCKDGANCHRPVCFFAHSLPELRAPTYTWVPSPADLARPPLAVTTANMTPGGGGAGAGGGGAGGGAAAGGNAAAAGVLGMSGPAEGVSVCTGSPMSAVGMDARSLLSHTSSGIPATSTSSDGTSSGAPASCGSPRGPAGSGNGMMMLSMGMGMGAKGLGGGGAGPGGANGSLTSANGNGSGNGCGGGTGGGSSSCSSGANGSPSPSCSVGSKDGFTSSGCGGGNPVVVVAAVAAAASKDGKCSASNGSFNGQSGAPGSGGKVNLNLTQPNAAASMLGFNAPRMSNAFARRHGLNPKDNPMLNLQKIALQSQDQQRQQQQTLSNQMVALAQAQDATVRNPATAAANAGVLQSMGSGGVGGGGARGVMVANGFNPAATAAVAGGATRGLPLNAAAGGGGGGGVAANGQGAGGFSGLPFASPASTAAAAGFSVAPMQQIQMQMHAALGGGPTDPSLLAAQLAVLNLHQQHQQQQQQQQQRQQQQHHHLGIGMGIGGINMASGAAAAAAAAAMGAAAAAGIGGHGSVQYMTAASPHLMHHAGMYGGVSNGASMYDHPQQHLMAAMSGTQAEV